MNDRTTDSRQSVRLRIGGIQLAVLGRSEASALFIVVLALAAVTLVGLRRGADSDAPNPSSRLAVMNDLTPASVGRLKQAWVAHTGEGPAVGAANTFTLQVGFKSGANNTLSLSLKDLDLTSIGLSSVNVSSSANAQSALGNIDSAISAVASARADYGSYQNRLEATISSLQVTSQNFSAAESRIRDADVAYETSIFTKNQILVQSGIAILAQANALPQQALALLK